jgi:hypothetical protein
MTSPPATPAVHSLSYLILGQHVEVACDGPARNIIVANYAAFAAPADRKPDIRYRVEADPAAGMFRLSSTDRPSIRVSRIGDLLFQLEKAVTVTLQLRRRDLLFLHAAALERDGFAYLLAGESGHGKSTTAWGLSHHGFRYLSDELSPIDLPSMSVLGYPHALCLKQRPPVVYALPGTGTRDRAAPLEAPVLDLGETIHVPVTALAAGWSSGPCTLGAIVFVRHGPQLPEPVLRRIGSAEAAARMYVSTLNALAHEAHGLDAVLRVVGQVPCFALDSADLRRTCELVVERCAPVL